MAFGVEALTPLQLPLPLPRFWGFAKRNRFIFKIQISDRIFVFVFYFYFFSLKPPKNDTVLSRLFYKNKTAQPLKPIRFVRFQQFLNGSNGSLPIFQKTVFKVMPGLNTWSVPNSTGLIGQSSPIFSTMQIIPLLSFHIEHLWKATKIALF